MGDNSAAPEVWEPCPPGQLLNLANHLRLQQSRRRRHRLGGLIGGVLGLLVATGVVWHQTAGPSHANSVDLRCQEVKPLLAAYAAGKVSDQRLADGIRRHLEACPPCAAMLEKLASTIRTPRARSAR